MNRQRSVTRLGLVLAVLVTCAGVATLTFVDADPRVLLLSSDARPWQPGDDQSPEDVAAPDPPPSVPEADGPTATTDAGQSSGTEASATVGLPITRADERTDAGPHGDGAGAGDSGADSGGSDEVPPPADGAPTGLALASPAGPMPDAAVSIDGLATEGAAERVAQGFLNSLETTDGPMPVDEINVLRPTLWRLGVTSTFGDPNVDWLRFDLATAAGADIDLLVSSAWISANQIDDPLRRGLCAAPGNGAMGADAPWENYDRYRQWLATYVHDLVSLGRAPTYWEPFNEPRDGANYNRCVQFTVERQLELWRVTYNVIRSLVPDAKVIGPSIAMWAPDRAHAVPGVVDLTTFVDFAANNGIDLGGLAWHEIGGGKDARPHAVADHVRQARQILDSRGYTGADIVVNEYLAWPRNDLPGWVAGYIAAFENGGATRASRTCGTEPGRIDYCYHPTIDGLLDWAGAPTGAYRVHAFYARMEGTRVDAESSDDDVSIFAVRDDGDQVLRALVGRHVDCAGLLLAVEGCGALRVVPDAPIPIAIRAPWVADRYRVSATRIPSSDLALAPADLPTVLDAVLSVDNGFLTVSIPDVADGDAIALTLTPLG